MSRNVLFADLYQMTMLRAYFELGMAEEAAFSLFVRKLPPRRNFLIACGLADLLRELGSLRFGDDQLRYLRSLGDFPDSFLEWLREFRFTGDIYALPEGTPFFANEPILEVVAPIAQAQLIETLVLNQIGLQTILASKAARIVTAARGRPVADLARGAPRELTRRQRERERFILAASPRPPIWRREKPMEFLYRGQWRIALSRPARRRLKHLTPSRGSFRKPFYWSTPTIRSPASRGLSRCPDRSGLSSRFAPFASIRATSINWLASRAECSMTRD